MSKQLLETPGAWIIDWETAVTRFGTQVRTTHSDRLAQIIRAPQVGLLPEARAMGTLTGQYFHVLQGRLSIYLFTMFERAERMASQKVAETLQRPRLDWPDGVDWLTESVLLDGDMPQLLCIPPESFYWVEVLTPALFMSYDDFAMTWRADYRPTIPGVVLREYL